MKVQWLLPTKHEFDLGLVFNGHLAPSLHRRKSFGDGWFFTIQDLKRGYNLCRIDYEGNEFTKDELRILEQNYIHITEMKLEDIKNGQTV